VQEVNQLLRQYAQMAKMFKQVGKGGLAKSMMRGGLAGHGRQAAVRAVGPTASTRFLKSRAGIRSCVNLRLP
jgi:hypothetical protein